MDTLSLPLQASPAGLANPPATMLQRLLDAWRHRRGEHRAESPTTAAQRVREYAFRLRETDPRMAADLLAAADRHERLCER
jgi:hypothetical protein